MQQSDIERSSAIQNVVLDKIAEENLGGRFWIKADGCNVSKGLRKSLSHVWSGDSDLGDGALQKQYEY